MWRIVRAKVGAHFPELSPFCYPRPRTLHTRTSAQSLCAGQQLRLPLRLGEGTGNQHAALFDQHDNVAGDLAGHEVTLALILLLLRQHRDLQRHARDGLAKPEHVRREVLEELALEELLPGLVQIFREFADGCDASGAVRRLDALDANRDFRLDGRRGGGLGLFRLLPLLWLLPRRSERARLRSEERRAGE